MEGNHHGFQNILKIFTKTEYEMSFSFLKNQSVYWSEENYVFLTVCGCWVHLMDANIIGKHVAFIPLAYC